MADDYTVSITLRARQAGERVWAQVKGHLVTLEAETKAANVASKALSDQQTKTMAAEVRVTMARLALTKATRALNDAEAPLANLRARMSSQQVSEAENALHLGEYRLRAAAATETLRLAEDALGKARKVESDARKASNPLTRASSFLNGPNNPLNKGIALPGGLTVPLGLLIPLAPAIVAVAAAVAQLAVALGSVIIVMGAFAAGLFAVIAVSTLGLGAFVALGAAVVLLANKQWTAASTAATQSAAAQAKANAAVTRATAANTAAQRRLLEGQVALQGKTNVTALQTMHLQDLQTKAATAANALAIAQHNVGIATGSAVNPMTQLKASLQTMAAVLGNEAMPAATFILGWIGSLIPQVQTLGSALIKWFGGRLPGVITLFNAVFSDLIDTFKKIGGVMGPFLDKFLAQGPQFANFFDGFINLGVGAFGGLLNNLFRLSDWFMQRLPAMGPIVAQIFSGIGTAIQWFGGRWGDLADIVVKDWPGIMKTFHEFGSAFKTVADFIVQHWPQIHDALNTLHDVAKLAGDTLKTLKQDFDNLVTAATPVAGQLTPIKQPLQDILNVLTGKKGLNTEAGLLAKIIEGMILLKLAGWAVTAAGGVMALARAFQALALAMLANPISIVIVLGIALGVTLYILWQKTEAARTSLGKLISRIPVVGGFFSALGSTIRWVGSAFSDLGTFIQNALNLWKQFQNSGVGKVIGAVSSAVGSFVGARATGTRAAGGPVSPYGTYLVGEQGPELLRMGSQSGTVVPNSAISSGSGDAAILNQIAQLLAQLVQNTQPGSATGGSAALASVLSGVARNRSRGFSAV